MGLGGYVDGVRWKFEGEFLPNSTEWPASEEPSATRRKEAEKGLRSSLNRALTT